MYRRKYFKVAGQEIITKEVEVPICTQVVRQVITIIIITSTNTNTISTMFKRMVKVSRAVLLGHIVSSSSSSTRKVMQVLLGTVEEVQPIFSISSRRQASNSIISPCMATCSTVAIAIAITETTEMATTRATASPATEAGNRVGR